MPKQNKSKNLKAQPPRVRGRGDYDVSEAPVAARSNPIAALDKRLSRVEQKFDRPGATPINAAASAVGRGLGTLVGQGDLGSMAGSALAKWFGHGDYHLKSNSLITRAGLDGNAVPVFAKDGRRGVRITEREYLGDVISSSTIGAFASRSYAINPAMPNTFPWLATTAAQFDEWEPHGIIFEFKSTSSEYNGTSQALGTVVLATDYNPSNTAYTNKLEMENADYSESVKASNSCVHGVECDASERADRVLYTRSGSLPASENAKFYDLGNFQIATVGCSAASVNLGELWVSYDVTFYKKQLVAGQLGRTILMSTIVSTTGAGITTSAYFGTAASQVGTMYLALTGTTITFPSWLNTGVYAMRVNYQGASCTMPNYTGTSNCLVTAGILPGFPYNTMNATNGFGGMSLVAGAGTSSTVGHYMVSISGPGAVITLSAGTFTTPSFVFTEFIQLPLMSLPIVTAASAI